MNKRDLKNLLTKRGSMWTLGLCMTGVIVLGGITAIDNVRREEELQQRYELDDTALSDQENADGLFFTLDEEDFDGLNGEADAGTGTDGEQAADADGSVSANADGEQWMDEGTDGNQRSEADDGGSQWNNAEADRSQWTDAADDGNGWNDGESGESQSVNAEGIAANADGQPMKADEFAGNTDAAANAVGYMSDMDDQTVNTDEMAAEEVSSGGIISEQFLLNNGISFDNSVSLMWPSAGTILIDYSMDSSVYFPTLNQYKYNPALIIGSETGNQVLAAAKGIVESVQIDEETGTTLVLNLGNDFRLTYGQMKDLTVAQGDIVDAGTVLGYIGEPTKYYSTEGSNLYFKMTQGETPVDPVLYLG